MAGGVGPTLGGFVEFVQSVMTPPSSFDAPNSPFVSYAFEYASQFVNANLQCVPGVGQFYSMHALAVYNLAGDQLVQVAQDGASDPVFKDGLKYWAYTRKFFGVMSFTPGVVQSTSDSGTSTSLMVPQQFANMTINDLQLTKTPYGRAYLGIAGSWGTLWGIS